MKSRKVLIIGSGAAGRKLELFAESKAGKASLRIVGAISNWNENNGKEFTRLVDDLLKKHTHADLYLNTEGGSVFEANEIVNQLKRFKSVQITVGALCASAGTYLAACFPTSAYLNSQFMIHKPMLMTGGNEDEVERDLKMLRNTTTAYKKAYAKKMGISEDEVEELWAKGDYWMTATEAKEKGLIDFILDEEEEINAEMKQALVACGAPNIPELRKPNSNKNEDYHMNREELIAWLGLPADATDAQIEAAKNQMKVNAAKHVDAVASKKQKDDDKKKDKAKTLVAGALKDKKITAAQVSQYEKLAAADYKATEELIDGLESLEKLSNKTKKPADKNLEAARKDWTLDDYISKDPEAYEQMKVDDPEKAEALEAAYFGN
ncbi:hypothetical protein NBRC110019_07510 [Neptunitalea chrysea]|uniref:ATP-dependent Clp protease proteolytic subunit n=1 Tax=Neptunitalea chrysea TaxID=1647581 RepID=A0A9W6EUT3_9FLAO|nr:Clp protease ClpP [Neptunitalea chrysea]GLB51712.1 hypothetical protein NBRC110019_07510 [Neptunitalea chrysea]